MEGESLLMEPLNSPLLVDVLASAAAKCYCQP